MWRERSQRTLLRKRSFNRPVTFGFLRNLDVAVSGRLGGWEHVWLIAVDYHTVASTARAECKGD